MLIKSTLTQKDFINVNFILLYSKTAVKIFTAIIIVFFIVSAVTVAFIPKVNFSQLIVPVLMLLLFPVLIYFAAKRSYAANKRISETIEYQFAKDHLIMTGESFHSQLTWDKVYKVTETKNWILIWQNRQIANAIPKRDVWDGQIEDLKKILTAHKIKNNLPA